MSRSCFSVFNPVSSQIYTCTYACFYFGQATCVSRTKKVETLVPYQNNPHYYKAYDKTMCIEHLLLFPGAGPSSEKDEAGASSSSLYRNSTTQILWYNKIHTCNMRP